MSFNQKRAKKSLARKRHSSGGHESIRGRGNGKSYPIRSIRIPYEDSPTVESYLRGIYCRDNWFLSFLFGSSRLASSSWMSQLFSWWTLLRGLSAFAQLRGFRS